MSSALVTDLKQCSLPRDETALPLVQCSACGKEPKDVVESPCCGDLWCWQCAVERPAIAVHCARCGGELTLESFRPAKAIQALLKRNQVPLAFHQLTHDDPLPCPENCGTVLPAGQLEEHIKTCGEVEEPCPNGCYERNMKRKDMPDHLRNDCPLASVPCKFGCDETILRREMDDHMKENVALHLEQLHATVEAQKARISELESEKCASKKTRFANLSANKKVAIVGFYLVALAMLTGIHLMAKLIVLCGALVGLRCGFKRMLGKIRVRRPFGPTETNLLFGMLCVAVVLTVWPFVFMSFHRY